MGVKSTKVIVPLPFPIKIDAGGGGSNGFLADSVWDFSKQYGAVGGTVIQAAPTLDITGTTEDSVFRSALEGLSFYSVRVPTDAGVLVTLMLVETKYQEAGKRVFDVTLNGSQTTRVDLYQRGGYNTAQLLPFTGMYPLDGLITLRFTSVTDKPVLSGIIIQSMADGVGENKIGEASTPLGFAVFPNPLNGTANFTISLPRGENVAIEIFDLLGRRVSSLPLGYRQRGEQVLQWNTRNMASGVYLCALTAGEQSVTRRILLVR